MKWSGSIIEAARSCSPDRDGTDRESQLQSQCAPHRVRRQYRAGRSSEIDIDSRPAWHARHADRAVCAPRCSLTAMGAYDVERLESPPRHVPGSSNAYAGCLASKRLRKTGGVRFLSRETSTPLSASIVEDDKIVGARPGSPATRTRRTSRLVTPFQSLPEGGLGSRIRMLSTARSINIRGKCHAARRPHSCEPSRACRCRELLRSR